MKRPTEAAIRLALTMALLALLTGCESKSPDETPPTPGAAGSEGAGAERLDVPSLDDVCAHVIALAEAEGEAYGGEDPMAACLDDFPTGLRGCTAPNAALECTLRAQTWDAVKDCDDECDDTTALDALGPKLVPALLDASGPALVGPLGDLEFELSPEDVRRIVPPLAYSRVEATELGPDDVTVELDFVHDQALSRVTMYLPNAVGAQLEEAWGEPKTRRHGARTWRFWFDREANVRAALMRDREGENRLRLELKPVQTLGDVLEADGEGDAERERLGFEPATGLHGADKKTLRELHGPWFIDEGHDGGIMLPAIDTASGATVVHLDFADGAVSQWEVDLFYASDAERDRILSRIAAIHGVDADSARTDSALRPTWEFGENPTWEVREFERQEAFKIEVE